MDLTTTYLGLTLQNPLVCGASPLGASVDTLRHLEDSGIAAVVLPSLFEEEILAAAHGVMAMEAAGAGFAEATSYLPDPEGYHIGPGQYLEHLKKAKDALSIPVIASLNGSSPGGWTRYAEKMQAAGADAIELNTYFLSTDASVSGADVENRTVEVVREVVGAVSVPVSVKLSPFFSSIPNLAQRLVDAGAGGLVLFNRFYQPDIDIEDLEVVPNLRLSSAEELRLRLRWLAVLSGTIPADFSCTGGAHNATDVIKSVMAGAKTVQMVSALLIHGADHIKRTLEAVEFWMTEHDYEGVGQMHGSMNLAKTPDPGAYTRANYMKMLDSWER
ncbi:MAG: dihydroorotate dehydrogenase-like protein [Acidobacteriota bacterium]